MRGELSYREAEVESVPVQSHVAVERTPRTQERAGVLEAGQSPSTATTSSVIALGVSRPRMRGPLADLASSDAIPSWVWHMEAMTAALLQRNIPAVFGLLQGLGLSQRRIAARTGQFQSEVSDILGGRHVTSYDVLARIGDGLGVPRGMLGLAYVCAPDPLLQRLASARCERCAAHPIVEQWTGREVRMLRHALRMSVREFASHLGVSDRMASKWESGVGNCRPRQSNQAALDTALARADESARRLFGLSFAVVTTEAEPGVRTVGPPDADPRSIQLLDA